MESGRIIVFDWPGAATSPLYAWRDRVGAEFVGVDSTGADWMPPPDTVLVVTAQTYSSPHVSIIRRCVEKGVPVLTLADGILDFRNTWRNPANPAGSLFMPALGHKMACLGRTQAARIASWGNAGVCEVVGFPTLDSVRRFPPRSERVSRVLVATANTPWFDETQREIVLRSLADLRDELALRPSLEVWWRVSGEAAAALGVKNHVERFGDMPMSRCIDEVDAVISTPSTLLLYPMLQGKPALALDYTGLPAYCRFSMTLASRIQVASALDGLDSFPADLALYQRQLLDDELEWEGSSEERLLRLVRDMAECGRRARADSIPPEFPARMLPPATRADSLLSGAEYDSLFARSHHSDDRAPLHAEVIRLREDLSRRSKRERELKSYVDELISGKSWLESQWQSWKSRAAELESRVTDVDSRNLDLERECGELVRRIDEQKCRIDEQRRRIDEQKCRIDEQKSRIDELESLIARFKATLPGKISKLLRLI